MSPLVVLPWRMCSFRCCIRVPWKKKWSKKLILHRKKPDSTLSLQKANLSVLHRMHSRITDKHFLLTTTEVNPRAYLKQQQQLHSPFSHITSQPFSLDLSNSHCTSLVILWSKQLSSLPALSSHQSSRILHAGYNFHSMAAPIRFAR